MDAVANETISDYGSKIYLITNAKGLILFANAKQIEINYFVLKEKTDMF